MKNFALLVPIVLCTFTACGIARADEQASEPLQVDFLRDVKPIFVTHCADCHGADLQESGFRLDAGSLAIAGGDRGVGVVPGSAAKSPLFQAIIGQGDIPAMPLDQPRLSAKEIDLIRRWIEQDAIIPDSERRADLVDKRRETDHWAFQPIVRPSIPQVRAADSVRNPIDAFVLSRLENEEIAPSPPADRVTLIRRLGLDLLGIPPTVAQVERFLADTRPGAHERLVDEILASPHFGERWGRHWLDSARYADSNGFTIDGPRSIWKYRDWVVDALNADQPFDEFAIDQLAGDMRPDATLDQIVATGFHRNTLINQEGGTNDEQFRVEAVVDRVSTTGSVFLGLTVACAQCHAHKYDPISQRDFYRMYAIFNSCADANDKPDSSGPLGPIVRVPTPEQASRLEVLETEVAEARRALAEADKQLVAGQAAWESQMASGQKIRWTPVDAIEFTSEGGATLRRLDDGSIFVGGAIPDQDVYTVKVETALPRVTAIRLEALTHDDFPNRGPGLTPHGNFTLSEFEVNATELQSSVGENPAEDSEKSEESTDERRVTIGQAIADYSQKGGSIESAIDGNTETFWGIYGAKSVMNADHQAIFVFETPVEHKDGTQFTVRLVQQYSGERYLIGRFRLSVATDSPDAFTLPDPLKVILAIAPEERSAEQAKQVRDAFLSTQKSHQSAAARLTKLEKQKAAQLKAIPTTMVLRELPKPRETHIQIRGDFNRPGARVTPGGLGVLPPLKGEAGSPNRLDFARWLFADENPLTARVTVNRMWQRLFGIGIVDTENDFGTQGSPPSHPELLDWLASEFQRQEWGIKSMLRLIVTSATYRQSSDARPELLTRDPQNRLLARQSRIRLEAEIIRDAALQASGVLSDKMQGPGVFPPQPEGIYVLTQTQKNWKADSGEDRFRRGLYTYFWRSSPYPLLPTFDAPDANVACTRRTRSNTPLQALTLANDMAFFELAQQLGTRILREGPDYDEGRLRYAFRVCLAREPNEVELSRLGEFLDHQRAGFLQSPEAAREVAPDETERPAGVEPAEAAAWTAVARIFLNLDEFITRE